VLSLECAMGRFYSSTGQFVGLHRLPMAAVSIIQAVARKSYGYFPREPWIPFSAKAALEKVLNKQSRVWEIGSGNSTLWFADRVGHITSIEADTNWFNQLQAIIAKEGLSNVDLRYEWHGHRMADFSSTPDGSLDLLVVDGGPRGQCLLNGFPKVKSGGLVYLDNWDVPAFWEGARDFPQSRASEISEVRHFVDYVPSAFSVNEGLLFAKR
jgi:predicted O-methyltransferase YrrM